MNNIRYRQAKLMHKTPLPPIRFVSEKVMFGHEAGRRHFIMKYVVK